MTAALIATKFFIPTPRPGQVMRDRLHSRFKKGLAGKLTVVSAPAGFGKTTLVSGIVRTLDPPAVWVSLEQSDSDSLRFITLIVEAIRRSVKGFGAAASSLLNSTPPPPSDVLLAALINDLASVTLPLVLVLDDYHALESTGCDDVLAFVLEHQPPCLHLIIATRNDPALPLARHRARGELVEFRAADLRFTEGEALTFFNQTMGLSLDKSQVAQLEARTEGWVAGLQLAALSLQGCSDSGDFIKRFTGSHRFVIDYLAEEVLVQLSEEMRTFLLQCSVLKRFDAALCDAITESCNSASMLGTLDRQNLFLIPLDEHRQWYRFHHLFVDVLHEHLRQSSLDTSQLHRRASDWLQLNGQMKEAIDHSLQGEKFENAAELIKSIWLKLRRFEHDSTLIAWMEALPESIIAASPDLSTWYGFSLLARNPTLALHWLETAKKQLDADTSSLNARGHSSVPGQLAIAWAYHAGSIGDTTGVVEHANHALTLLANDEFIWRALAAVLLGLAQWSHGDLKSAFRSVSQGMSSMKQSGEITGVIGPACVLADICIAQGNYKEAARVCHQAVSSAQECESVPQGLADVYVTQASLALCELKLDQAQALQQQAADLGEHVRRPEIAHLWYVVQAQIESIQGHYDTASDLLEEAREVKKASPIPDFAPLAARQARLDILAGDLGAASRWANASELYVNDEPMFITEYGHLTLVRLLLARSHLNDDNNAAQQALDFLSNLAEVAESDQRTGSLMENWLLTALCHQVLGDDTAALLALQSAFRIPEARSQASLLIVDGPDTRRRLSMLMPRASAPLWATEALQAADQQHTKSQAAHSPSEHPGKQALLEPLSDRELDVLRQLRGELSGPQIADHLFVSLNTLRTHSRNIYNKLQVNNRRAAVRRARELGVN